MNTFFPIIGHKMSIEVYRTSHYSVMNKIGARLVEAKIFLLYYNQSLSIKENIQLAYQQRWFGNSSEDLCKRLIQHFKEQFLRVKDIFHLLRSYVVLLDGKNFHWVNHFFMVLNDPYYRWASSVFFFDLFVTGHIDLPKTKFEKELRLIYPDFISDTTLSRCSRNILTSLRDNKILEGDKSKKISNSQLDVTSLGMMMYFLTELGLGANDFDQSPLHRSLLKSNEALIPLLIEGEQLNYWEFYGDQNSIRLNLTQKDFQKWLGVVHI